MNPFAFFLAIADKVHTALNLLDPTRTYAAADALWARQRGAGRLAEREAGEEVMEPEEQLYQCGNPSCGCDTDPNYAPYQHNIAPPQRGDRVAVQLADGSLLSGVFNPSFPGKIDTDPERWNQASRLAALDMPQPVGTFEDDQDWVRKDIPDGEAWEPSLNSSEIVAVRQLIEERFGDQSSAAPASQTDAPGEASGVPEGVSTPDPDAPSGHLTLGNDPSAVHERALRRQLDEDRPYVGCGAPRPYGGGGTCTKPSGHQDRHGYAGIFWHDDAYK